MLSQGLTTLLSSTACDSKCSSKAGLIMKGSDSTSLRLLNSCLKGRDDIQPLHTHGKKALVTSGMKTHLIQPLGNSRMG